MLENLTVAELVLTHPASARILQRHRIDFCCRGKRPLAEACSELGLDAEALLAEIRRASTEPSDGVDLRALPTEALLRHVVERHHAYLREALPFVRGLAAKVARVHGAHNESLIVLSLVVEELAETLEPHLDQEEAQLFPALVIGSSADAGLRGQLESMEQEHLEVGQLLQRMRTAADDYRVPDWACGSYRGLFAELERLETDTLLHVHTENHVLGPRFGLHARSA